MKSKLNEVILQIWDEKVSPLFKEKILSEATINIPEELTTHIFKKYVDEDCEGLFSVRVEVSVYDPVSPMIVDFYYKNMMVEGIGFEGEYKMRDILKACIEQDTNNPRKK